MNKNPRSCNTGSENGSSQSESETKITEPVLSAEFGYETRLPGQVLNRRTEAAASVLLQTAHDLKAPISALNLVIGMFDTSDPRTDILKSVAARLTKLADGLDSAYSTNPD
ncbi:MAG: hypothetical protein EOP06_11040 [Proteobacteria bacterium]|nr:MAG: hypothetical protein EOP06_11040 [Pseudomonadota bacterium]